MIHVCRSNTEASWLRAHLRNCWLHDSRVKIWIDKENERVVRWETSAAKSRLTCKLATSFSLGWTACESSL